MKKQKSYRMSDAPEGVDDGRDVPAEAGSFHARRLE